MMGDRKKTVSAILGEPEAEKTETVDTLHAIAEELIDAIHSKNVADVASCLRTCFMHLDAEPHEEGPHTNED